MNLFHALSVITLAGTSALCASAGNFPENLEVSSAMEVTVPSGGRNIYGNGAGFNIGAAYKLPVAERLAFKPALAFFYNTMSLKNEVNLNGFLYQGAAKNMGLRIPLMMEYTVPVAYSTTMSFATGPWLNLNFYARQNIQSNPFLPVPTHDNISLFDYGWKKVDAQWGFKLAVTFAGCYRIGVSGGVAFTPLASFGVNDKKVRVHRNTVAVSLEYLF